MKKLLCQKTGLFIFCGILAIAASSAENLPEPGCARDVLSREASPDSAWTALVQEDVCSHETPFTTVVLDRVQLVRPGKANASDSDVLIVDGLSIRDSKGPPVQWLTSRKLQITLPNRSTIGLRKREYDGVEIVVKFSPNDPEERARWLRDRGLPLD